MSLRRYSFYFFFILLAVILVGLPSKSQYFKPQVQSSNQEAGLTVGRNVNMVSGTDYINGDPYLQRQNEPSMAVSTRNYFTLVAGANDYRTVDMPQSEGPLPGIPEGAAAGDAWLGLFKSFNGGESWISMLLPGHPKDTSVAGRSSPLYGFSAASDPTVRAGTNGLFYYSGIAFDRAFHGRSVIFVARFIDNNVLSSISTQQLSTRGLPGSLPTNRGLQLTNRGIVRGQSRFMRRIRLSRMWLVILFIWPIAFF